MIHAILVQMKLFVSMISTMRAPSASQCEACGRQYNRSPEGMVAMIQPGSCDLSLSGLEESHMTFHGQLGHSRVFAGGRKVENCIQVEKSKIVSQPLLHVLQ